MGVSYGISCPGPADCVIVGVGALTTGNGGATWTRRSLGAAGAKRCCLPVAEPMRGRG